MRALVMSGGGSKGSYQVGVLKKLLVDDNTKYDLLAGVSVGAINAAFLAQYSKDDNQAAWENLKATWDQVTTSKVRKRWCPFGMVEALWKPSIYNSEPLQKWVRGSLDVGKVRSQSRPVRIVAVSWDSGESRVITEKEENLADWVLASSAFPIMLTPISIGGEQWTDGGVRNVTPLGEAIRAGATDIDVIITSDPDLPVSYKSAGAHALPGLTIRALELMSSQIMRADLKICGYKNDLAGPYKQVNLRVIMPKIDLDTIQDSLSFEPAGIQKLIEMGYEDAKGL